MKQFKINLSRSYIITINAQNKDDACRFSEYYLGDCPDLSMHQDRINQKFEIKKIEMTYNDAEAENVELTEN